VKENYGRARLIMTSRVKEGVERGNDTFHLIRADYTRRTTEVERNSLAQPLDAVPAKASIAAVGSTRSALQGIGLDANQEARHGSESEGSDTRNTSVDEGEEPSETGNSPTLLKNSKRKSK
jgi:hypothetical protein